MKRISTFAIAAFFLILIFAGPGFCAGAAAVGVPALAGDAYDGMEGFRIAAAKYWSLTDFLDGRGLSGEKKDAGANRAAIALSQNDYAAIREIRAAGGKPEADLRARFRGDAVKQLAANGFATASAFLELLADKNKGNGYAEVFLKEAEFEFLMDAAYAQFQGALAMFKEKAPASEAAIGRLKAGADTATRAAYFASDLIVAANTLGQNTAAASYFKKYAALLEKLNNSEDRDALITTYGAMVGSLYATGDEKGAVELTKKLEDLAALEKAGASEIIGSMEGRIGKPNAEYDMMYDKSIDFGDTGSASGGGSGSSASYPNTYELTISNITAVQFEEVSAAFWSMEGYEATGVFSNEKNIEKAEIITKGFVTAEDVASFLNSRNFEGFILRAAAAGGLKISAKAVGIPREKFDAMATAFNYIIEPDDASAAGEALSVVRSVRAALVDGEKTPVFRTLLSLNLEGALARMSGDYKTFGKAPAACDGGQKGYARLSGLCAAQWALGAADAGNYPFALSLLKKSMELLAGDEAVVSLARAAEENAIALRLASGVEDKPQQAAARLKELAAGATGEELLNLRVTIANSLYAGGDYEGAYAAYEEAEKSADDFIDMEQARALILLGKGNCRIMQARHADAVVEYTAAAKAAESAKAPLLEAAVFAHLASVLLYTGDYAGAEGNAGRAAEIADRYENARLKWQSLYTAARALDAQDKRQEALDKYLAALDRIESAAMAAPGAGPAGLSLDAQDVYRYAASLCARMDKAELALQILERGKISALREEFEKSGVAFKNPAAKKAASDIASMKGDIAGMENAIQKEAAAPVTDESKKEISYQKERIQDSQRRFIKYVNGLGSTKSGLAALYNIEPVELVKVRKKLPDDMAVLYYLLGDTTLYIFYVRADSIGFKEVPVEADKFEAQVRLYRNYITKPSVDEGGGLTATQDRILKNTREAAGRLYDILIKPVSAELADIKTIAIIPNGILNFIPYEALTPTDGTGDYLLNRYAIFYVDSLATLEKDAPAGKRGNVTLYAFGNADDTLPAAEREVETISKIFSKPNVFIRRAATEEKAKEFSEKGGIFHFATHGTLDFKDISKSFITLSAGGGDDGKLTIEEVWGYWWGDTSLVALSACNTATGDLVSRGKVMNPAGAFLNAGAPSVLATLWSVDDAATATLMEKFYGNLSKMGKVEALRAAQLDLLKDPRTAHPYYWAPFTLIGDWR